MLWSILRIGFTTIFALIAITLCLIAWSLSTTEGSRDLANIIHLEDKRFHLNITSGNLLQGIAADQFTWKSESISISAANIKSKWNSYCLLKVTFCADSLIADKVYIELRDGQKTQNNRKKSLSKIDLPVAFNIGALKVKELTIVPRQSDQPIVLNNVFLQASTIKNTINIAEASVNYLKNRAKLEGTIELEENISVSLQLDAIVHDVLRTQDLNLSADLHGNLSSLNFSAMSFGALNSSMKGSVNILRSELPIDIAVTWADNRWSLKNGKTISSLNTEILAKGDLHDLRTSLKTQLSVEGYPESKIEITGNFSKTTFRSQDIEVKVLQGIVKGDVDIDWREGINWSSSLYFEGLNPEQLNVEFPGNLAGIFQSKGNLNRDNVLNLQINPAVIQGELRGHPLHIDSILAFHQDTWKLESLRLSSEENNLSVSGEYGELWDISGKIALSSIEKLLPGSRGDVSGNFSLRGDKISPDIRVNLSSTQLRYEDLYATNVVLEGDIQKLGLNKSDIKLKTEHFEIRRQAFTSFTHLYGTRQKHQLSFSSTGPQKLDISAKISGNLDSTGDWTGVLYNSHFAIIDQTYKQKNPANLSWSFKLKEFSINAHCWTNVESQLCLQRNLDFAKKGRADIQLNKYPLSSINQFLENNAKLSGLGDINLTASWDIEQPQNNRILAGLDISQGKITIQKKQQQDLVIHYESLNISTVATKNQIEFTTSVETKRFGTAKANFVLDPKQQPMLIQDSNISLNGLDLTVLESFLPEVERISGQLSVQGKITGNTGAPIIKGTVILNEPELISEKLPIALSGGQLVLSIQDKELKLRSTLLSGSDKIDLSGTGNFINGNNYTGQLNIKSNSLRFSQKPLVSAILSPDINVEIKPARVNVTGSIGVTNTDINIKSIPEGATATSPDVVVINQKPVNDSPAASEINTNIAVVLGKDIKLTGYGLKATLAGDFQVKKTAQESARFFGEIEVSEGTYKSYGQDLTIDRGQILLVGPIKQTALDIEAFREVDSIKAGLRLTGTVDNLIINLYSDPSLEQERILSYIVLGRDIRTTEESSDNSVLSTAAVSMGIYNGRGLATNIAETFGVEDFNIEAAGRGDDTQVLLSGRLSPKLVVRYGIGVFTPVNTLFLRYDLGKQVYLETTQGLESAVDLFYSFAF